MKYLDIVHSNWDLPNEKLEQRFDQIKGDPECVYLMHGYEIGLKNAAVHETEIETIAEELLTLFPQVASISIQGCDIVGYCPMQFPLNTWISERSIAWELKRIQQKVIPEGQHLFFDAYVVGEVYLVSSQEAYYKLLEFINNHEYLGETTCPVPIVSVRVKPEYG